MSMARLNRVQKAAKPQGTCQKCGAAIDKGDPYVWWKFRYSGTYKRCTRPQCQPQPWERESNQKRADLMQAEDALAEATSATDPDDAGSYLDQAAELVRGVAEQLEETASAWQGTNLEYSEQYQVYQDDAASLTEWADTAERVASDLHDAAAHGDATVKAAVKRAREADN